MTETETTEERDEFAEWRATVIATGRVAAAYTGSYGGLYGAVAGKLGLVPNDIDPELAARGLRWEKPVADAVHVLTGYYVHGEQLRVNHPDYPHHACILDGLIDPLPETTLLTAEASFEIKTVGLHTHRNDPYYRASCQWQMHVTGKQQALLAVARIDDTDDTLRSLTLERVDRDQFVIDNLIDVAETIWGHVQAGTLPDPDLDTDPDDVKQVNMDAAPWTTSTGKETPDPETDIEYLDDQLARYLTVLEALKPLEAERTQLENLFRHEMGDGTTAESDTYRLRVGEPVHKFTSDSEADALDVYPAYAKIVLDRARFKTEEPDLYDAFKRPTTDRRITVKELRQ